MAHDTWKYGNARETFSHAIPDPHMMHAPSLDASHSRGVFYEHPHAPCVPISYDYCDSFDHDVNSCPLISRSHILGALASFNKKFYLHNLLKTDLTLASPTPEVVLVTTLML